MKNRLPDFIVIGAQKSASTFIQQCLSDHPDVFMPKDEIPFFESPDYNDGDINEFFRLFFHREEKLLGLKRPQYIGKKEVPERIYRHLPNVKLIAILRHPVDRALSSYFHYIKYSFLPCKGVEEGMRDILNGDYKAKYPRSNEILEFGFYYRYLRLYNRYFKKEKMLILLHEDIVKNPIKSIQLVYNFLNLSSDFVPPSINKRPQRVIYNITRLRILRMINCFLYEYNKNKTRFKRKKGNIIVEFFNILILIFDKLLSVFFKNKKPIISKSLRNELLSIYLKDIISLEKLININLDHWKDKG